MEDRQKEATGLLQKSGRTTPLESGAVDLWRKRGGSTPAAQEKGSAGGLRRRCHILCEMVYKPGSVLTAIYLGASLPIRSSHLGDGRASLMSP